MQLLMLLFLLVVPEVFNFSDRKLRLKKNLIVEISHRDSDLELSPANSPTSSISEENESANAYTCSCSSSFSLSSSGCCSGSITEEEEGVIENLDAEVEKLKRDGVGILGRGNGNCKAALEAGPMMLLGLRVSLIWEYIRVLHRV
ncbi:unnamed protein product [Amaranthus hypochondriacus]